MKKTFDVLFLWGDAGERIARRGAVMTYGEWCDIEAARINAIPGRSAVVKERVVKGQRRCAVFADLDVLEAEDYEA